jgi:hypothetical protein
MAGDPWTDDAYFYDVYTHNITIGDALTAYTLTINGVVLGGGGLEIDPVFTASPAFGITAGNIATWNNAPTLYVPYNGATGNIDLNAKEVTNGTLNAVVGKGTWTASGVWKLPAMYFNGDITTDRWLSDNTNTFLGRSVVGLGNLSHTGGSEGYYNTAFGYQSLNGITTGTANTAFGNASLPSLTDGNYNTVVGSGAMVDLVSGSYNTAVGLFAGHENLGDRNVFVGSNAGYDYLGDDALFIDNSSTATPLIYGNFSTNTLSFYGIVGIGVAAPTANLHIKAGTAAANTAPFKFTSGTLLATPEAGAIEYDGTHLYYTDDTPTRRSILIAAYAGAYLHENVTTFTIEEATTPHGVHGWTQGHLSANWTYYAGKSLAVTAWADNGDGKTKLTCNLHGMANGDIVTIANTTSYDGIYLIEQVAANTFVIQDAWVADEGAKTCHAAAYLTNAIADSTGTYLICGMASCTPSNSNDVFEFEFYASLTELTNTECQVKLGAAGDFGVATTQGIIDYTAGQKIWVKVENYSGAGDITIRDGNITVVRIQ